MVLLVIGPLLLGVLAYRLPVTIAKGALIGGQVLVLGAIGYFLWQVGGAGRSDVLVESLGGAGRALYIELLGNGTTLSLVALTGVLFLAGGIFTLPFADNKLILLLLVLQGLANGLFLTDDIFNLFVILEVTTLVLVLLNVFRREVRSVYDALYYLIVQIAGMAFFLLGAAFVYRGTGVLSMSLITEVTGSGSVSGQSLVIAYSMMLAGLALKVGLFPLFSYVPRFYGNPGAPIVVLMLSSAVISTAVLYWIARITWAIGYDDFTGPILLLLGIITALAGAAKALANADIRLVLAFSTVSQAGLALIGLSGGIPGWAPGFTAHLFTHAVAKALLFLGAAYLAERYGTTDLRELKPLIWQHPPVAVALVVGAISLIGLPLTAGGVSKYWIMGYGASPVAVVGAWAVTLGTSLIMAHLLIPARGAVVSPEFADFGPNPLADGVVLLGLALLVFVIGFFGAGFFTVPVGYMSSIGAGAQLVKAGQVGAVMVGAWALNRWWPRTWLPRVRQGLAGSLSLPDACLALACFFALILALGLLPVGAP
ncbi:MAG: hypothetical protein FWG25_05870 [Promicromonosporaceae bacterium]|nr:hypothetical protein [Promicromonosporaceae bacterium]